MEEMTYGGGGMSRLTPKGSRVVATGGAARRRSRPTRNPWIPSVCCYFRSPRQGRRRGVCTVLTSCWPIRGPADLSPPSSTPPGWNIRCGLVVHGFRSPSAYCTRGYSPSPLPGLGKGASVRGGRGLVVHGFRSPSAHCTRGYSPSPLPGRVRSGQLCHGPGEAG